MDSYKFTKSFQEMILAVMIKDHEIVTSIKGIIQPKYFNEPIMQKLAADMLMFEEHFHATPSKIEYIQFCIGSLIYNNVEYTKKELRKKIIRLFNKKVKNKKYVIKAATEFAQFHAMKNAILESTDLLDNQSNRNQIQELIRTAMQTGMDARKLGINIFDDRYARAVSRELYGINSHKVTTGLKKLDRLLEGGLDRGELGVILAPPKGFKTGTLVNLGVAAMSVGLKVAHYTLEVSDDRTTLRYERRISGLDKKGVIANFEKLDKMLKRIHSIGGELVVKEFPMGTATVSDIDAHLEYLSSEGFIPDLVIIDYGDLLKPSTQGELRHQLGTIYAQLRALAQQRNIPIWTASQASKKALGKQVIRKEDVAEAYVKVAVCDLIIAVCQTKNERLACKARLFVATNREGEESGLVYIDINYSTMRIKQGKAFNEAA